MLDLWSKKLLGSSKKLVAWESPSMSSTGTFGGSGYGIQDSNTYNGVTSNSAAYNTFNYSLSGSSAVYAYRYAKVPAWVTFYSPKPMLINKITILSWATAGDAAGVDVYIEGSNDNSTWDTLYYKASPAGWYNSLKTFTFDSEKTYKYIRFRSTYSAHTTGIVIGTIHMYGFIEE